MGGHIPVVVVLADGYDREELERFDMAPLGGPNGKFFYFEDLDQSLRKVNKFLNCRNKCSNGLGLRYVRDSLRLELGVPVWTARRICIPRRSLVTVLVISCLPQIPISISTSGFVHGIVI